MITKIITYIKSHKVRAIFAFFILAALLVFIAVNLQAYHVVDAHTGQYAWNRTLLVETVAVAGIAFVCTLFKIRDFLSDKLYAIISNTLWLLLPFVLVYVCEMMYETSIFYMSLYKIYLLNVMIIFMVFAAIRLIIFHRAEIAALVGT